MAVVYLIVIGGILALLISPKTIRRSRERGPHTLTTTYRDGSQEVLNEETDFDFVERVYDRLANSRVETVEYHRGSDGLHRGWQQGVDDPYQSHITLD